ncbi:MAG: FeS assembly protein SufD [Bacteroidetes bacterium]|nr:MAG: FeS assembly protein SufD [Bacteroidota bacterium]
MSTVTTISDTSAAFLTHFEANAGSLFGETNLRRKAAEAFAAQGIPTRRTEDYRYLNLELLLKKSFGFRTELMRIPTSDDVAKLALVENAIVLVIVNGVFVPQLSSVDNLLAGLKINTIADAVVTDQTCAAHYAKYANVNSDPFIALNTMLASGGVFIHVAKNAVIDRPVHILHIADNEVASVFQPRHLVVAETGAQIAVIESFESIGPVKSFTNALIEVAVSENAVLDHYRIQAEGPAGHLLSTVQGSCAKGSLYNTYTFSLGGAWVRNNVNKVMAQAGAEAHLYGLYLLNGSQVCDNHTIVDHAQPNCLSNELYKGVIDGKATAVFNGKIFVRPDAQKTNAYQTNKNVLLSDDASVNTKPQLEIYADDVKCSHGTSTGRIDEDALFYLRTRGIGQESARRLLIHAFAEEVVDKIKIESLRIFVEERITAFLG